eukprot:GEMP01010848.1.p1 GENE.GEMP01010848.1~~GEMP01010848.1.p1  ORF type:complete len:400 (-),score=88.32 GEMP01010848.1:1914-3113(-)
MGGYLSQPVTEKHSDSGVSGTYKWVSSEMQGWRTTMEDAHICGSRVGKPGSLSASLFVVFDGHGGHEVAQFCASHFTSQVEKHLKTMDVRDALLATFHGMDDQLRLPESEKALNKLRTGNEEGNSSGSAPAPKRRAVSMLQTSIQGDLASAKERGNLTREEAQNVMLKMMFLKRLETELDQPPVEAPKKDEEKDENRAANTVADNVGCTAVSCVIFPEPISRVYVANAGDSRCIMSRVGKAFALSFDHKPDQEVERKRIEAAGGWVEEINNGPRTHYRVNGNLNLSRALGDLEYKKRLDLGPRQQVISATPDIIDEAITQEDEFIVLACDGIWDIMSNQDSVDFVRRRLKQRQDPKDIVEQMLDHCMAKDPKLTQGLGGDNMTCIVVLLKPIDEIISSL